MVWLNEQHVAAKPRQIHFENILLNLPHSPPPFQPSRVEESEPKSLPRVEVTPLTLMRIVESLPPAKVVKSLLRLVVSQMCLHSTHGLQSATATNEWWASYANNVKGHIASCMDTGTNSQGNCKELTSGLNILINSHYHGRWENRHIFEYQCN